MDLIKKILKWVWAFFDLILFASSPMFVLLFIVGLISLGDQYGQYNTLRKYMQDNSFVVQAEVIDEYNEDLSWTEVAYTDQQGEQHVGFVRSRYHPEEMVQALQVGQQVTVRYSIPTREGNVILETHYLRFLRNWGFDSGSLIVLFVSWVLIILYPHVLYVGVDNNYWKEVIEPRLRFNI